MWTDAWMDEETWMEGDGDTCMDEGCVWYLLPEGLVVEGRLDDRLAVVEVTLAKTREERSRNKAVEIT